MGAKVSSVVSSRVLPLISPFYIFRLTCLRRARSGSIFLALPSRLRAAFGAVPLFSYAATICLTQDGKESLLPCVFFRELIGMIRRSKQLLPALPIIPSHAQINHAAQRFRRFRPRSTRNLIEDKGGGSKVTQMDQKYLRTSLLRVVKFCRGSSRSYGSFTFMGR